MKKYILLVVYLISFFSMSLYAENGEYAVSRMKENFQKDDAVYRKRITKLEIKSASKAIISSTIAVTIMNKNTRNLGILQEMYDKFHKITEFSAVVYNAAGEEVKTLESDDIGDVGGVTENLYDDYRIRFAELYYDQYPYTIEYKSEMKYSGSFSYPEWYSRTNIHPVEYSKFTLVYPEDFGVRYWCNRDSIRPVKILHGDLVEMVWEENNLPGLSKDAYENDIEDIATQIMVAADKFELDDISGDMHTWDGFGKSLTAFYFNDEDKLDQKLVSELQSVLLPSDDRKTKVAKLYRYMQKKCRYISIQLGIGGWKPFSAKYVHERGYGDCKALTNYMRVLLHHVNIPAYPVLINMNDYGFELKSDFPSNQFNHVILGVPMEKDTLYLECTSTLLPAGRIHEGIENRQALWLAPHHCSLVKIPPSSAADNCVIQKSEVALQTANSAIKLQVTFTGNQISQLQNTIHYYTPEERDRWLKAYITLPDVKIISYSIDTSSILSKAVLNIEAESKLILSKTGSRLFLLPNLTEKQTHIPAAVDERYSPISFSFPTTSIDRIKYHLPEGYVVESIPAKVDVTTSFGRYQSEVIKVSETEIEYKKLYERNVYEIPAENYEEYRKFKTALVKADKAAVVLVKKP